jgi:crotonobetainyl-CoA:carnitine CoA-transferase CaiB-like acyl-CoA transferase
VVDLTSARSGPTCTRILADFGADVIWVERPGGPSFLRASFDEVDLHRGKKSVILDLGHPDGVAVLKRLVAAADVVVENYRPSVKRRLGIDYETLAGENPRLIYASISGFGQSGPYSDRPGYDQIVQGLSGLMSLTGTEATGPLRVGIPIADLLAGYFAAVGILLALLERERSGRGQWVETSLLAALVGSLSFQGARYLSTGEVPPPVGNHHPLVAPMGVYRARDGHLNLAVGTEVMWGRLCRALGRPELGDDPRFRRNQDRVEHRVVLNIALDAILMTEPVTHWVRLLNAAGVACGEVYRLDEVFADPQVQHARLVSEVEHPVHGLTRVLGIPVGLHRTPARISGPSPIQGEHTRGVLERLGYAPDAIADLLARGVAAEATG